MRTVRARQQQLSAQDSRTVRLTRAQYASVQYTMHDLIATYAYITHARLRVISFRIHQRTPPTCNNNYVFSRKVHRCCDNTIVVPVYDPRDIIQLHGE